MNKIKNKEEEEKVELNADGLFTLKKIKQEIKKKKNLAEYPYMAGFFLFILLQN